MAVLQVTAELLAGLAVEFDLSGTCLELARQDIRVSTQEMRAILQRVAATHADHSPRLQMLERRLAAVPDGGPRPMSDKHVFGVLGIDEVVAVDASDFEGAEVIHDMNLPGLAQRMGRQVDFAVETGTAEHVFHLPNYLQNVCETLRVGGVAVHFVPAHGYLDHGFYQFSPTLFVDFYQANGFEVLDVILLRTETEDWSDYLLQRYTPGEFDTRDGRRFQGEYVVLGVAARRVRETAGVVFPQQRFYREQAGWQSDLPPLLDPGVIPEPLVKPFTHLGGHCWEAGLSPGQAPGDSATSPRRSRMVLLEDGMPLPQAHALHLDIRQLGAGRYSHWGSSLLFATSDNSDSNLNGRHYTFYEPAPVPEYRAFRLPESRQPASNLAAHPRPRPDGGSWRRRLLSLWSGRRAGR